MAKIATLKCKSASRTFKKIRVKIKNIESNVVHVLENIGKSNHSREYQGGGDIREH